MSNQMQNTFTIRFSPLQGYTDAAYREAHARFFGGVECYYSPFARVEHGEVRQKDVRDIEPVHNAGLKLVPQFIASDIGKAGRILALFSEKGYREANLNLGCPFPVLARRHNGSGMLPYPEEVEELLTGIVEKFPSMSLSVKLRAGWESPDESLSLLPLFNRLPLSEIILHPRLGKQQYKGSADMEAFAAFYEGCEKPLFYNGDLRTADDIDSIRKRFPRLRGVAVGRGLFKGLAADLVIDGHGADDAARGDLGARIADGRIGAAGCGPESAQSRRQGFSDGRLLGGGQQSVGSLTSDLPGCSEFVRGIPEKASANRNECGGLYSYRRRRIKCMPDYPHGIRSAMALKTVCRRIRCSSKEICLSSDEGKILEKFPFLKETILFRNGIYEWNN